MLSGSGTCSSISMQVTTSYCPGSFKAKSSALMYSYSTFTPLSRPWRSATLRAFSDKSTPFAVAPVLAMASVRMPPPQPTSSTFLPAIGMCFCIQSRRSGLMAWRGLNSLVGSHQRWARALNLSNSF